MPLPACPKCRSSGEVFYSRTTAAERALGLFRVFPFRCVACSQRFFRFAEPQPPESAGAQDSLSPPTSFQMTSQPFPVRGNVESPEANPATPNEPGPGIEHEQTASWQAVAESSLAATVSLPRSSRFSALAADNPHWFLTLEPAAAIAPTPGVTVAGPSYADIVAVPDTHAPTRPDIAAAHDFEVSFEVPESSGTSTDSAGAAFWAKDEVRWTLRGCAVLLGIQIAIGVTEGSALGLAAMWVNLLTVKSLVAAWIVFLFLRHTEVVPEKAAGAVVRVTGTWVTLFFLTDVCVLKGILPLLQQTSGAGSSFRAQAPWIWLSYALIPLAGVLGFSGYRWSLDRPEK